MTIGRRIIGSISGLLFLLTALAGMGIGVMVWLRSWHDSYVKAAQRVGALEDAGLQEMLSSLDFRAAVIAIAMGVVAFLIVGLAVAALIRLGPTVDRRLRGAVSSISDSVGGLLAVASEVSAASAETAAATNETTATVEEVKQTALLAQEKANEAFELARNVVETSMNGQASARRNSGHFELIQTGMDDVAHAIDRLDEHTKSVGEVMITVNDIAEQSNLLAVNASIEAAKSGEAGKGFNVVAQEVKTLAGQSKQAVEQVRAVLGEIRKASDAVVRSVDLARETVDMGRDEAGKAVENNIARVAVGEETAKATEQISVTSRQQIAGVEQIRQAVSSIDEASGHFVAGMRTIEGEVQRLQVLATGLEHLVKRKAKKTG